MNINILNKSNENFEERKKSATTIFTLYKAITDNKKLVSTSATLNNSKTAHFSYLYHLLSIKCEGKN